MVAYPARGSSNRINVKVGPKKKSPTRTSVVPKRKSPNFFSKIRRFILPSILFVVVLGIFALLFAYRSLTSSFISAFTPAADMLMESDNFSVLIIQIPDAEFLSDKDNIDKLESVLAPTKLNLYVFDVADQKILNIDVPINTVIDVPGRFGEEPFENILKLSLMDNKNLDQSYDVLVAAVSKVVKYPVDSYMVVTPEGYTLLNKLVVVNSVMEKASLFESFRPLLDNIHTPLSSKEKYYIASYLLELEERDLITSSLSELTSAGLEKNPIKNVTINGDVAKEGKSVSVLNASGISGMATYGSDVIENLGGRVVAVSNAASTQSESILVVDDMGSKTVANILRFFPIKNVVLKEDALKLGEFEIFRSDITLIVGLDIAQDLN